MKGMGIKFRRNPVVQAIFEIRRTLETLDAHGRPHGNTTNHHV
jgi:hypothetical protein